MGSMGSWLSWIGLLQLLWVMLEVLGAWRVVEARRLQVDDATLGRARFDIDTTARG